MTTETPNDYSDADFAAEPAAPPKRRQCGGLLTPRVVLDAVGETLAEERAARFALQDRVAVLERTIAELRGIKPIRAVPATPSSLIA